MLKLFFAAGACSLASHIALEEAGATYETERVDLSKGQQRSPEYLRVNPEGRVPALVTDRGVLTQSPAILAFIAQSFPEAGLAPLDDPFAFADMQAFNVWLTSHVHIAYAHVFRPARFGDEAAAEAMKVKALETLSESFARVAERLGDGRAWVHGGFTISDPYLYVFERWAGRVGVALPEAAQAHMRRLDARPATRRALQAEGLTPV